MDQMQFPDKDHPKGRSLEASPVEIRGQQMVCIQDPLRLNEHAMAINPATLFLMSLMDGTRDILDIQADFARQTGQILFRDVVDGLVSQLDEACLLENEHFRDRMNAVRNEFLQMPMRSPRHAGISYPADPDELADFLEKILDECHKSLPIPDMDHPPVGLIAPHIDFNRGAEAYAAAYGTLRPWVEKIDLFVILGTCHSGLDQGFALTRKDYETPQGPAETDRDFVDRLSARLSCNAFEQEFAHRDEHSIEFQAVWLRHILPANRPLKIVPILCGGLLHCIQQGISPENDPETREFCAALVDTIEETDGTVCVIAGVDLAHMGPQFGGTERMTPGFLAHLEERDRTTLEFVERIDPEGFYQNIASELDERHICGFTPIYVLLRTTKAEKGSILRYQQTVNQQTQSVVSFTAAMLFG